MLVPVIIAVAFIVFTLMDLAPGDQLTIMNLEGMIDEDVAALRTSLGLDKPLVIRFAKYMYRLVQGDLGVYESTGLSVWEAFITRLPNTLVLALSSFVIGVIISLPLGIFAARHAGKITDNITTTISVFGMSIPGFWMAIILILIFSYYLGWLPAGGFNDGARSVVLPAISGSLGFIATSTRQTRSSMVAVLNSDYLRTARAKGVPEGVVIREHALGNALIPIITTMGATLSFMIAGTAIIETVYSWPGIGRLVVGAVNNRDVTATTGIVILTTIMYCLVQLMVDIAYTIVDPRLEAQFSKRAKRKIRGSKHSSEILTSKRQVITLASQTSAAHDDTGVPSIPVSGDYSDEIASMQVGAVNLDQEAEKEISANGAYALETDAATGELLTRKYKRRSKTVEVFHHLSQNKGAVAGLVIIALVIILFVVSLFIPFDNIAATNVSDRFYPPSFTHLFGTDGMGRDLFIRVIYSTRFSLPIGFGATTIAAVIGIFLGSLAAYYSGTAIDDIIMRFSDVLHSIPGILLGMVIITTLGRSLPNLIIAVGVSAIPVFMRISRASILSVKGNEFVEASRAIGFSNFRIIFSQILPNGIAPIIVTLSNTLGTSIMISAGLSFMGFGIQSPYPEWGSLAASGRDYVRNAPWLTAFPGLLIMVTVMAFVLLGDGLRDALDPKLKRR
jgi:ABC-type dipeptide/oligopeptide/nickel transport system permease component